jgi:hypothetical protein
LYHEKRISLVNFFVFLLLLKNIVQGRKGYLKVEKRFQIEKVIFYFSIIIQATGRLEFEDGLWVRAWSVPQKCCSGKSCAWHDGLFQIRMVVKPTSALHCLDLCSSHREEKDKTRLSGQ